MRALEKGSEIGIQVSKWAVQDGLHLRNEFKLLQKLISAEDSKLKDFGDLIRAHVHYGMKSTSRSFLGLDYWKRLLWIYDENPELVNASTILDGISYNWHKFLWHQSFGATKAFFESNSKGLLNGKSDDLYNIDSIEQVDILGKHQGPFVLYNPFMSQSMSRFMYV